MTLLAAAARMPLQRTATFCLSRPIITAARTFHCSQRPFASKATSAAPAVTRPTPAATTPATAAAGTSFNLSLALSSLNAELTECLLAQDAVRAEKLIRTFEIRGGHCTLSMLNTLIGCYRKSAKWREAQRAWDRIVELGFKPNSVSYRNLIKVYMRQGSAASLTRIDHLLAQMKREGLRFSAADYEQFIRVAANRKLPVEVARWSNRAREAGVYEKMNEAARAIASPSSASARAAAAAAAPTAASTPSPARVVKASNRAIWAELRSCIQSGDSTRAEQIIREKGKKCDVQWLSVWIGSYALKGDWRAAERALQQLLDREFTPCAVTYRHLIRVYLHTGSAAQLAKIDPLLAQMSAAAIEFTALDYRFLIETSYRCKLPMELLRWTTRAQESGVFAKKNQLQKLLASLPKLEPLAPAVPIIDASKPGATPDSRQWLEALKTSCVANGKSMRAGELIRGFEKRGGKLDASMANVWIASHQRSGDWAGAERVWARMSADHLPKDSVSYRNLIQVYIASGLDAQLAKIDAILAELEAAGLKFGSMDLEHLIKTAHRCRVTSEITRWNQRAVAAGVVEKLDDAARALVLAQP